jgi:CheY-like chemotaxis protein
MDGHARLALIGRLLRAASHELNNPLTTISGFAQFIAARSDDMEIRADAEQIVQASAAASNYVAALAKLTKGSGIALVDLATVVDEALALLAYEVRAAGIALDRTHDGRSLSISAPVGPLMEAVLHVAVDAVDAFGSSGDEPAGARRLTVATESMAGTALLRVEADGAQPGRPWIGLNRCREIAGTLGGALEIGDGPGPRVARLRLPLATDQAMVGGTGSPAEPDAGHPFKVLVADDDPGLRLLLTQLLSHEGLAVEAVATAEETVARALQTRPDRLLVDFRMPGGGGRAIWDRLVTADRALAERIIFVTADGTDDRARRFIEATGRPLIHKPFRIEELRAAMQVDGVRPGTR